MYTHCMILVETTIGIVDGCKQCYANNGKLKCMFCSTACNSHYFSYKER